MKRVALVALVACGNNKPAAPPTVERFGVMTPTEQCDATAARAVPCIDALLLSALESIGGDPKIASEIVAKPSSEAEARKMHRVNCVEDANYPPAVVECWTIQACPDFAKCVRDTQAARRSEPPHVREDERAPEQRQGE